ncbi:ribonuclease III [Candidatus Saccharibacteria bacterium]|nr:ribonuclease III [Candidatus Saccharibacteria bacterium]
MDVTPYQQFAEEKLGGRFDNIDLLVTAFTHRSYVNEHKKSTTQHNERLEFLGDAVLELVVTEALYANYSEPEGILTNWRAALVRTESISAAASRIGFMPLMRLSRGEKQGSERAKQQILANAFEAVTGALYLERGYDAAKTFITDHILSTLGGILETGSWRDSKSHLQEVAQSIDGFTPQYRVLHEEGPDHDKVFTLGVFVGDKLLGRGEGPSKQFAQQKAAEAALVYYKQIDKTAKSS